VSLYQPTGSCARCHAFPVDRYRVKELYDVDLCGDCARRTAHVQPIRPIDQAEPPPKIRRVEPSPAEHLRRLIFDPGTRYRVPWSSSWLKPYVPVVPPPEFYVSLRWRVRQAMRSLAVYPHPRSGKTMTVAFEYAARSDWPKVCPVLIPFDDAAFGLSGAPPRLALAGVNLA
jgi:hypothetical protein